jgi:hypothetical protein
MPTPFRTLTVIAALLTLVLSGSANAAEDGFKLLFNGRDLSGWRPVNTASRLVSCGR